MGGYILGSYGPYWNGVPMIGAQPDVSGITLCVDCSNGLHGNTGQSWNNPLKTLKQAITISNTYITDNPNKSRRNTIFIAGGPFVENLDILPDKTDIIGCGSYPESNHASIIGTHTPVSGTGTRFFNIWFRNTIPSTSQSETENSSDAAPITNSIFSLTSAVSGVEFHNCILEAASGSMSTINITASPSCVILDCKFTGKTSTASIAFFDGNFNSALIRRCDIRDSEDVGILVNTGASATNGAIIEDSHICSTNDCIYDPGGTFHLINNNFFTSVPAGAGGSNAIRCSLLRSLDNRLTCASVINAVFPARSTL